MDADTFSIKAVLVHNGLSIELKDYLAWKVYAQKYTNEDIGKDINAKVELEDIFYAFSKSEDEG